LPVDALPTYAEALDVPQLEPCTGRPSNEGMPSGPMRELLFGGNSQGTITYLVVEDRREVGHVGDVAPCAARGRSGTHTTTPSRRPCNSRSSPRARFPGRAG